MAKVTSNRSSDNLPTSAGATLVKMTKEERAAAMRALADEQAAEEEAEKQAALRALDVDRTDDSEEGVIARIRALEARMDQLKSITAEAAEKLVETQKRFFPN